MDSLRSLLRAVRNARAPIGVATRVIAVDGPGGAGKTTLAAWLGKELDAPIVHTDEFASWHDPVDWWPDVIERVPKPLAAGDQARYRPTSWAGEEHEQVVLDPSGGTIVLEGVTAT